MWQGAEEALLEETPTATCDPTMDENW